jgi:hypothetical protein
MIKLLLTFTLALFALTGFGQADLNNYLKTHHYSFSLDKGFDTVATDSLKRKFSNYNLVILGEGGSVI